MFLPFSSSAAVSQPKTERNEKPIAIYHEHPDWFKPLFEELDRREQFLDPANSASVRVAHHSTDEMTDGQFARHHFFSPCEPGMRSMM